MKVIQAKDFSLQREETDVYETERAVVKEILARVQAQGDAAVRAYTARFDGVELDDFRIPEALFEQAYAEVGDEFLEALRAAIQNIRRYHEAQKRPSWMLPDEQGSVLGQIIRPLKRVGVYVPGGRAAYPSSVLMNVIPAQVAGVPEIVLVTPPDREGKLNPGVLVAIKELGLAEAYRIGGAQAVGALAYGTETIGAVDKIVGPGNIYVALAKQAVFGQVAIDMIAGPSEILVIADDSADPDYVAADMLSQAEHDPMAAAICVTPSGDLACRVAQSLVEQLEKLPRREIAEESLRNYGSIVVTENLDEAIAVSNRIAPEHLELMIEDATSVLGRIENAGAIFVGRYSSEPVGDYFAGPNHVLPTSGTARFSSPLNVDDFVKKSSVIQYGKQALLENGEKIITLAEAEGLQAHANAIRIRLDKEGGRNQS
ncbi:histidinol dehydrogenase [Tumebacillus flagellatus]|uniref:Histidinol dehydrogenase n=1 Tax=Tumebacillus flagellatus TaxID=1157490 RepID=A0A074LNB6_9BACL|nr:histidinol dehydrogenase [Tumebacillus flagellatus]KEO81343.1 histidinol dehydrogenase [Tumebacillus flagellatus]